MDLESLSKENLIKLCKTYAKNWLAHDGCWFLSAENAHGLNHAIELDKKTWEKFTVVEAKRIMEEFNIPASGGLDALEKALGLRLYATVNKQEIERAGLGPSGARAGPAPSGARAGGSLIFKMVDCRVQSARRKKGLPDFPCREVGLIEYSGFAKTIDPRIKTKCLGCPPDKCSGFYCAWEFYIK